jgi:ribulose-phosphate 3-epimerase
MIEIIPAILPQNIGELRGKVGMVKDLVETVQFDMCDGVFVSTRDWPYNGKDVMAHQEILNEETGLPYWDEVNYEFDLMVKNASKNFQEIMKLGPTRVVFHLEAEENLTEFFETLDPYFKEQVQFGIAINTTTDPARIAGLESHIAFIQCMGIESIGRQGQDFDTRVIEQIKTTKKLFPDKIISVDGAVNKKTAHALIEAGATRLVIGSAIFKEIDIAGIIEDFRHLNLNF